MTRYLALFGIVAVLMVGCSTLKEEQASLEVQGISSCVIDKATVEPGGSQIYADGALTCLYQLNGNDVYTFNTNLQKLNANGVWIRQGGQETAEARGLPSSPNSGSFKRSDKSPNFSCQPGTYRASLAVDVYEGTTVQNKGALVKQLRYLGNSRVVTNSNCS